MLKEKTRFGDVHVTTERLKQRSYHEFEASLGCIVKACLKIDDFSPINISAQAANL